jgi:hypothetical protein
MRIERREQFTCVTERLPGNCELWTVPVRSPNCAGKFVMKTTYQRTPTDRPLKVSSGHLWVSVGASGWLCKLAAG